MVLAVSTFNDVKAYNLSAGKSLPQFFAEARAKKQSLRYNEDYKRRLELLHDFEFPGASSRVKVSRDGQFICATGIYPPEMRLFDTEQMGLKLCRRLDQEVVDMTFLSDDYRKLAFLAQDRHLEFHAQYGKHHKVRLPKQGRSVCYEPESCHLFVGGSGSEIFRLDLEQGQFAAPLASGLDHVHMLRTNEQLPLLGCAGSNGQVECWDLRAPRPAAVLTAALPDDDADNGREALCLDWSPSGMLCAVGLACGVTRVFDVRSHRPVAEREQRNGLAIGCVKFHQPPARAAGGKLICASADEKCVKLWGAERAEMITTVESEHRINDVAFYPNSGLMFLAVDQPRVGAFFIPHLGIAPKWCSFLDSVTEELEENPNRAVFDDFQFVSKEMLEQLGAEDLIGTKFLQPYLHGYLIEVKFFQKLKLASEPFAYEEYRKKKIAEKIAAKRTMRVRAKSAGPPVNENLHAKLRSEAEAAADPLASKKGKKAAEKAAAVLQDDRFATLFSNPDFQIEEARVDS